MKRILLLLLLSLCGAMALAQEGSQPACVAKRAVCEPLLKHREADPKGPPLFVFVPGPAGTHPDPVVSLQSPSCQAPVLPGSRPARLPSCQAPVLPGSRPARLPFCQALAFVSPCSVGLGEGPWGIWGRLENRRRTFPTQCAREGVLVTFRRGRSPLQNPTFPKIRLDLPRKQSRPSPQACRESVQEPPVSPLSGPDRESLSQASAAE